MPKMPGAVWRPLTTNYTERATKKRRVILHTSASVTAKSLHGWFSHPSAKSSSHFHVDFDGRIEQYIDTDHVSWASGEGNGDSISVETQGAGTEAWTSAQVAALVKIVLWAHRTHGVPLREMKSSAASEAGIGWHRLGVDGYFPALPSPMAGRLQRGGGQLWSSARGKSCPGDLRIRQIPGILDAAKAALSPAPKPAPAPSSGGAGTYTVKAGDTWWSISRKLGVSMDALIAANGATPTTTLYAGQQVRVTSGQPRRYKITGADSLNVRTGPGTKYAVLGSAPKGTIITATGRTSGGWIEGSTPYMASRGQTGWLSGAEMSEVRA